MTPRNRPGPGDPILLLTPEDYRRFSASPPPPPRKSRRAAVGLFIVVLVVAAAAQVDWSGFRPAPEPPAAPRIARRIPKAVESPPPPPATRTVFPSPEIEPEESAPPAAPAVPVEERKPWNGGRAWARIRLRVEQSSRVRESEHRVTLVWDGSSFVLERPPSDRPDAAMDRLELLLHLPSEEGSWRRQISATVTETLPFRAAQLACKRVEGEDRFPQGSRRFRYWYSEEFPAGAVQAEQTIGEFTFLARVLDFGAAEGKGER